MKIVISWLFECSVAFFLCPCHPAIIKYNCYHYHFNLAAMPQTLLNVVKHTSDTKLAEPSAPRTKTIFDEVVGSLKCWKSRL